MPPQPLATVRRNRGEHICCQLLLARLKGADLRAITHGQTGYHVPSRKLQELAARIVNLLDCDDCRRVLWQAALEHAQQYTWPQIVRKVMSVYAELLCLCPRA